MKYNLGQIERLFEEIQEIIEKLEEKKEFYNQTTIYLANGDNIRYCLPKESIPHLLGINVNYLQSLKLYNETNAYKLLKLMCEDSYKIYNLMREGKIDCDKLVSPHIKAKMNAFWTNISFNAKQDGGLNIVNDTELIIKYDSSRSYKCDLPNEKLNYAIIRNISGKYFMLWLVKNESGNYFYPMSNRVFDCFDDMEETLERIMTNQEITILNAIKKNNDKPFNLRDNFKIQKITILQKYNEKYNCSIVLTRECKHLLSSQINHRDLATENYTTKMRIVEAIRNGEIIDISTEDSLIEIANAFNDLLTNSQLGTNGEAAQSFSEQKRELEELRKKVIELGAKLAEIELRNLQLTKQNETITDENKKLSDTVSKVFELVRPKIDVN